MTQSQFPKEQLDSAVEQYVDDYYNYYLEWLFDKPIVTSSQRIEELRAVGLSIHKLIKYVAKNFVTHKFYERMPVSDRVIDIFNIFNQYPYDDIGTYRTDFVFDTQLAPKLIEITCQFSLNAFYQAAVYDRYSNEFAAQQGVTDVIQNDYRPFHAFMAKKIGTKRNVCIIKGRDKIQSSRFFAPILKSAGLTIKEISYRDVWANKTFIENALVINECMMDEIETLSDDELHLLAASKVINDYRTIFVAHDKRFFAMLNDVELQKQVLTADEMKHLTPYLIKSFQCSASQLKTLNALETKDQWVLKHVNLGRSRQIYAGLEMTQAEWQALLEEINYDEFVIQEWVEQRKFSGSVNGIEHDDYLTGTLLYFDKKYFGLGLFRMSSHFVANKVDNRNIFPLVVQDPKLLGKIPCIAEF